MKYRNLGLLSISLAATAALIVYAGTTTNAQSPSGSTSGKSHAHDHDHGHQHDGHDHSHAPSSDPQSAAPVVVPAPSGGPPPLPSQPSSTQTPRNAAPQRQAAPNNEADSPPSLSPPRRDEDYGCQRGDSACPNIERYSADGHYGDYPLDDGRHGCPFGYRPRRSHGPYPHHRHLGPFDVGATCDYGVVPLDYHYYGGPCEHGLTHYGH